MRRSRKDDVPSRDRAAWREHLASIRLDADPAEADWWETDWPGGTPPAVGFLIPGGFEAYARVLHPASDAEGRDVTWAEVAGECGTTLHPEAQWDRLAGGRDLDPRGRGPEPVRWSWREPDVGCLPRTVLESLADVLSLHTATPESTVVGFWVGYGEWPAAWRDLPSTRRTTSECFLFERPISAVATLCAEAPAVADALGTPAATTTMLGDGARPTPEQLFEMMAPHQWRSPTVWWPADRGWATCSDPDLDSTVVGGTRALVDDLLADERLEVLPWPVDGSLWAGADSVNR